MNIFEYAMQMELDGKDFYEQHAAKIDHPALKKILLDLAADEIKHYGIFKALSQGEDAEYKTSEETTILASVKNVFQEMRDKGEDWSVADQAKDIWVQARDVEKKAEDFFREKANEVTNDNEKFILERIADEEHKHWITLENVIQFLDRPQQFIENAEWNDTDNF